MAIKVYVVIVEDRCCDPEALVFSSKRNAIKAAKELVDKNARSNYRQEHVLGGRVYHCTYSPEGDCVTVRPRFIDGEV